MNQQAMPSGPSLRTSPLLGWNTSTPFTLTCTCPGPGLVAGGFEDVDVRLAEDDEELALAGVLQVAGHVQVGVHPRLEWFAEFTTKWLRRGTHHSVADLILAVEAWVADWNKHPRPFIWHKTADQIFDNLTGYPNRIPNSGH